MMLGSAMNPLNLMRSLAFLEMSSEYVIDIQAPGQGAARSDDNSLECRVSMDASIFLVEACMSSGYVLGALVRKDSINNLIAA